MAQKFVEDYFLTIFSDTISSNVTIKGTNIRKYCSYPGKNIEWQVINSQGDRSKIDFLKNSNVS